MFYVDELLPFLLDGQHWHCFQPCMQFFPISNLSSHIWSQSLE